MEPRTQRNLALALLVAGVALIVAIAVDRAHGEPGGTVEWCSALAGIFGAGCMLSDARKREKKMKNRENPKRIPSRNCGSADDPEND